MLTEALVPRVTGQVLAIGGSSGREGPGRRLATKRDEGDSPGPGLTEVLAGNVPWDQAIRSTRIERLDVLDGQVARVDGRSDVAAARWAAALREFRREYQFVLIDASPADDHPASTIAPWADATYLMIRQGRTGRGAARRALRAIRNCGARVLGCVVAAST